MISAKSYLDAASRDSAATPTTVAETLRELYTPSEIQEAINQLWADESWSEDRQPYDWLDEVREEMTNAQA